MPVQPEQDIDVDVLKIDNAEVRARQLAKLQQLKGTRDVAAVEGALAALAEAARGDGNLLEFAIRAARADATVGEISLALEKVFGRHAATVHTISGVYRKEIGENPAVDRVQDEGRGLREEERRASRASWSPKWDRTATTAARKSSPPPSPISAST